MNARIAALVLLVALTPVGGAFASDATFDMAKSQGRDDSTNPAYQRWYLEEMRPAFTPIFQHSLGRCVPLARGNELISLGLVFVVKADGSVGDFFASRETKFARCLEDAIRARTYPPAPKDGFYFGFDFAPQSASA